MSDKAISFEFHIEWDGEPNVGLFPGSDKVTVTFESGRDPDETCAEDYWKEDFRKMLAEIYDVGIYSVSKARVVSSSDAEKLAKVREYIRLDLTDDPVENEMILLKPQVHKHRQVIARAIQSIVKED